jgi:hypothetical protein
MVDNWLNFMLCCLLLFPIFCDVLGFTQVQGLEGVTRVFVNPDTPDVQNFRNG